MAMTNELRRIIIDRLNNLKTRYGISEIGYRLVQHDELFPHLVVDFPTITPTDMGREDFALDIHIWGKDQEQCFDIMDAIRDLFTFWLAPDELVDQVVLPVFYELSGGQIDDTDKTIVHLVLRYQGQVYERMETNSTILWKEN